MKDRSAPTGKLFLFVGIALAVLAVAGMLFYASVLLRTEAEQQDNAEDSTTGAEPTEFQGDAQALPADAAVAGSAITIEMTDRFRYEPGSATITVGQTVTWVNSSMMAHTVTADPGKTDTPRFVRLPPGTEPFDSGTIGVGEKWSRTFTEPGVYRYFCTHHEQSRMTGELHVQPEG